MECPPPMPWQDPEHSPPCQVQMTPLDANNSADSTLGWVFLITNLVLEILSVVLDQLSSPSHPRYALFGMLVSLLAAVICIVELIHKGFHPNKLFGSLADIYGLLCALSQFIFSAIKYSYHIRHANYPVKLSVLPVIFLSCVVASRLIPTNHHNRAENTNSTSREAETIISISTQDNLPQQQSQAETVNSISTEADLPQQQQTQTPAETIISISTEAHFPQQQQTPAETINSIST